MSDTTAEPITLEAFTPADLLMDANARWCQLWVSAPRLSRT